VFGDPSLHQAVLIASVSAGAAAATTADTAATAYFVANTIAQLKWPVGAIAPQDMFVSAADIKLFTSAKLVSS
jgi:hypothetical protein